MRQKIAIVVVLVVVGILAGAAAAKEKPEDASLREQLKAHYKLARLSGVTLDTAEGGTILTIEKPGMLGSSRSLGALNTYRDGVLHAPDKFSLALMDANIESVGQEPMDRRPLPVGDKVYVLRIDASVKREFIQFGIVECNACNGVTEGSPYEATVEFHFPKGYLETASVAQVEDTISQVFAVEGGTQQAQAGQAEAAPEQPAPPTSQPAPAEIQATTGPALINDDIIKLVQVKLADSVIIAKIQSSTCAFDTSADGLVRLKQVGVSDAVLQAILGAGGQAPPTQSTPPAAAPAPPAEASCADYQSCLEGGIAAMNTSKWDAALADFQRASSLGPSEPGPWAKLGKVYLATGQYQNAVAMWDKVLGLGGRLAFDVWHYKASHYERGYFYLGAKEVSFVVPGGKKVFSVAPTEVSSVRSHQGTHSSAYAFLLKLGGRDYWFSFVPLGVQCENPIKCNEAAGYDQEGAVSNYVAQTIGRLAPGSLEK